MYHYINIHNFMFAIHYSYTTSPPSTLSSLTSTFAPFCSLLKLLSPPSSANSHPTLLSLDLSSLSPDLLPLPLPTDQPCEPDQNRERSDGDEEPVSLAITGDAAMRLSSGLKMGRQEHTMAMPTCTVVQTSVRVYDGTRLPGTKPRMTLTRPVMMTLCKYNNNQSMISKKC